MLKITSTSCGPTYIKRFLTIFGQCINVLNYKRRYASPAHAYAYDASENQSYERCPPYRGICVKIFDLTINTVQINSIQ